MAQQKPKAKVRQVKNPETFRERALKVSQSKENPKARSKFFGPITKVLKTIFGPIGKLFEQLSKVKALKPVFSIGRFIGRIIFPKLLRSSFSELKQVTWPTPKQSVKLTYAVLVFAVIFGSAVALLDYGLGKIFKHLLLK